MITSNPAITSACYQLVSGRCVEGISNLCSGCLLGRIIREMDVPQALGVANTSVAASSACPVSMVLAALRSKDEPLRSPATVAEADVVLKHMWRQACMAVTYT